MVITLKRGDGGRSVGSSGVDDARSWAGVLKGLKGHLNCVGMLFQ